MKNLFVASTAIAISIVTSASMAGYTRSDSAYCYKYSDGSGYCQGTFRGFRNDSNVNSRIDFYLNADSIAGMTAQLNGVYYSCYFATGTGPAIFASAAAQVNGFFAVSWNASGTCTYGYSYQGSSNL